MITAQASEFNMVNDVLSESYQDYRRVLPEVLSRLGLHPWSIDAAVSSAYLQEQRQLKEQEGPAKVVRIEIPIGDGTNIRFLNEHFGGEVKTPDLLVLKNGEVAWQYKGTQYYPRQSNNPAYWIPKNKS